MGRSWVWGWSWGGGPLVPRFYCHREGGKEGGVRPPTGDRWDLPTVAARLWATWWVCPVPLQQGSLGRIMGALCLPPHLCCCDPDPESPMLLGWALPSLPWGKRGVWSQLGSFHWVHCIPPPSPHSTGAKWGLPGLDNNGISTVGGAGSPSRCLSPATAGR